MKYILIIGDGMGDEPMDALGGKTPIEAADTPVIDRLARAGEQLLVHTVPAGYPPGSDVANLSLFGYEPEKYYTGRAPLEAASMGVKIGRDELAFRCNLVTVDRQDDRMIMLDYSAGHITTTESTALIEAIQECCGTERVHFYPGISYRHLMILKGEPPKLNTVPPHDYMDRDVSGFYNAYLQVDYLKILLEKTAAVLAEHPVNRERIRRGKNPANGIWLWGEGKSPAMETLTERFGIRGSLISAVDLLKGLGICAGLAVPEVEGATGYIDTNYEGKVEAALQALHSGDLAIVHLEGPDEAGHQGALADKVQAIRDLDSRVVAPIVASLEQSGEDFRLVVTMDHYTPLALRTHVDWPVPMLLYDSRGVDRPSGRSYSEANARAAVGENGLELASGADFFNRFIRGTQG
ncbi:MAG TPA: cofactor-independent phosphoglycerate mutase [Desulfobulbus sp.]|nr:cofactor-independent phosphoglycerate mutase [Desulfobulbus sp.]